jgi:tetratricopeptide (TPR) repeat protein
MSREDENKALLVPSQPAALSRAGAASLATRGLRDLLEAESVDEHNALMRLLEDYGQLRSRLVRIELGMANSNASDIANLKVEAEKLYNQLCDLVAEIKKIEDERNKRIYGRRLAEFSFAEKRRALEAESADAWCERGYELWGLGKSKWKEAVACYRRGLELDPSHAGLHFAMGFAYRIGGGGVEKDEAEALRWYRKAAEQGHARAQWDLGYIYEHGDLGVARDEAEARLWYRKAENSEKRKP